MNAILKPVTTADLVGDDRPIYPTTLRGEIEKILRDAEGWMSFEGLQRRCTLGNELAVWTTLEHLHRDGNVQFQNEGTRNMLVRHVQNKVAPPARDLPLATSDEAPAPRPTPPTPAGAGPPPVAPSPVSHAKPTGDLPMPHKPKHGAARDLIIARVLTGPATVTEIAQDTGCTPATVSYHARILQKQKLFVRAGDSRLAPYQATTRCRSVGDARGDEPKTAAAAPRPRAPRASSVTLALDKLQLRLAPAAVEDLSTKVQVLERLGKLVDPTIAKVLTDIRADLQRSAA